MSKIRCPNCKTDFEVNENLYSKIVQQVRTQEFQKEINEYKANLEKDKKNEIENAKKDAEVRKEQALRELAEKKDKEINDVTKEKGKLESECNRLNNQAQAFEEQKKYAITQAVQEKEKEITELQTQLKDAKESERNRAIVELSEKHKNEMKAKEEEMAELREKYDNELNEKSKEIKSLMDQKELLIVTNSRNASYHSTKMIGEDLEKYCETRFDQLRSIGFQNSFFEKDTNLEQRCDYIFKEKTDTGVPYISIAFEMKNESKDTKGKQKNEKFFKKLDEDRNRAGCDYAVLVSTLEEDNEYYNTGIVEVHQYPKMYVVRPQFFITIISLLRNAAEPKKELIHYQNQNVDVSHFEESLNKFKDEFAKKYKDSQTSYIKAIESIDTAIKRLEKAKEELRKADQKLSGADNVIQEITIRKLTYKNPTMQQKFKEAKKLNDESLSENRSDDRDTVF